MSQKIELESIASQEFTITLAENNYEIRIFSTVNGMAYDLIINDKIIILGFQLVNQVMLMPYKYQEISGNLLLVVPDEDVPDYKQFGDNQFLYFLNSDESELYRNRLAVN